MPVNAYTVCTRLCGRVCFPFDHTGSLTFTWGEQTYTKTFDGEVCVPYLFGDEPTTVEVSGEGFEGFEGFTAFYLTTECVQETFEITMTGEGNLTL